MLFKQAVEYILNKLEKELPKHLHYHNINHVKDVYEAARCLGKQEDITIDEMKLLLTAASFHDAGFINSPDSHEEDSCRIVREVLPVYNYTTTDIDQICEIIMATKIPQSPKNHLGQILADADLDYLGRDDFFAISQQLCREMLQAGTIATQQQWNYIQVQFLERHQYFTATAIKLRQPKKQANLDIIKHQL